MFLRERWTSKRRLAEVPPKTIRKTAAAVRTTVAPDANVATDMIANPGTDQGKDKAFALRLRIQKDGKVTVINERNGFNKTYGAN